MPRPRKTVIEFRNYDLSPGFPVLLLEGDRWHISDVVSEHLHFHNCLEIGLCHSDSGTMIFDGITVPFHEGDVTFVPRHVPHTTFSSPGQGSLWTYVFLDPGELLSPLMRGKWEDFETSLFTSGYPRCLLGRDSFPKVNNIVRYIIDELHERGNNYKTAVEGLLLALFMELQRVREKDGDHSIELNLYKREKLNVGPALSYIGDNYMNELSIPVIAELCHLSTTHFRRAFQSIMGDSPLNYINTTRIEKACTLLRTTDRSVLSISEAVGFTSISSFNRYFKRITGSTPREYRNSSMQTDNRREKKAILEYSGWQ